MRRISSPSPAEATQRTLSRRDSGEGSRERHASSSKSRTDRARLKSYRRPSVPATRPRDAPARLQPGRRRLALGLEGVDRLFLLQGEADIVETVDEAVLAEGIDVELDHAAIGAGDLLAIEIDGDDGVGAALGVVHQ